MPFQIGNPGKPKGAISKRTREWEQLGDMIRGQHASQFNRLLMDLWQSDQYEDRIKAANLYLSALEYFQPKLARQEIRQEQEDTIDVIEVKVIRQLPDDTTS